MSDPALIERMRDRVYRLSCGEFYKIMNERGEIVPFIPNEPQRQFLAGMHCLNIILKARQLGFTTLCCLLYLDAAIFEPNTRAGVIAHKLDDAKVIFRDKIKFAYDNLPDWLKGRITSVQDSADTLTLSNGSSIRVSTSMRSGTLQYLHISEFGKICANAPDKAREIVTGALNAVAPGQFVCIESTAEGQEGAFFRMTQQARDRKAKRQPLTELDYKFHFFPWHEEKRYRLDHTYVTIGADDEAYFRKLSTLGIEPDPGQKAWYVRKSVDMAGDMKREFPSTADEAFEQALEGAYFSTQLYAATKAGRIGGHPFVPGIAVNTFWDLGRNDNNTIWLHQVVKARHRFIGYYENSGEYIAHYVAWLREWARDNDAVFGDHYLPHDGDRESLWLEHGTMGVLESLKFRPKIVERPQSKLEAIALARAAMAGCEWDEGPCQVGLGHLRAYRKEWDDDRGIWRDKPRHDAASHGADGFLTFACSDVKQLVESATEEQRYGRDRWREGGRKSGRGSQWAA